MSGPSPNSRLYDLAVKYASDKLYWHSYIGFYQELFDQMTIPVRRVLEVGIGHEALMQPLLPAGVKYVHGSSLRMWEEYWPNAQIYGCDIREDVLVNEGRIQSCLMDQSNAWDIDTMLRKFGPIFDVIIDDGSHQYEDQHSTATKLLNHVNPGGVYIIEDVWPDKGAQLALEFGGMLWRGDKGRDDNLVVIYR